IEQTLRTLLTTPVNGGTPGYQTLTSVGISSGPIGSTPGTTSTYQVDDAKLTAALQSNPDAVRTLFTALTASLGAVTQTSGSGNAITGASGTPTDSHLNGTYVITVLDSAGNAQVQFNAANGQVLFNRTGVLSPNSTNTSLIPGVTLTTGGTIQPATFQFSVNWTEGVANSLNDYLNALIAPGGLFDARTQAITNEQQDITDNINNLQQMLDVRQQALEQQFSQLEATLALLQSQGNALGMQILGMGGVSGSSSGLGTSSPAGSGSTGSSG
ncbi:MAG TPA: flagellar filament capping protein FliD, partial [Isosphaeraceae bacterium]|nr:flagellar filament capping protein FliD [Isosphaeraceae bacterium]